jgi:CMP-N,N'-diacetyllegionaminic acid synthase
MSKIYCFDLDNTLCITEGNDYPNSKPIQERLDCVNRLHSKGNKIIIFTSRGQLSGMDYEDFTILQLHRWELNYDELLVKPHADVYVDDKAMHPDDFSWEEKGED